VLCRGESRLQRNAANYAGGPKLAVASASVAKVGTILLTLVCSKLRAITAGGQARRKPPAAFLNFFEQYTTVPMAALSIVETWDKSKITRVCFS